MEKGVGSIHTIIRNRLGIRKVSARWVPHHLTSDQAERCLDVATANLSRFNTVGENFLSRIVAIDETWLKPKVQTICSVASKLTAACKFSASTVKIEDAYDLCVRYSGVFSYP